MSLSSMGVYICFWKILISLSLHKVQGSHMQSTHVFKTTTQTFGKYDSFIFDLFYFLMRIFILNYRLINFTNQTFALLLIVGDINPHDALLCILNL